MIVVSPAEEDEYAEDAWQGSINKVIILLKKLIRTLEEAVKKNMGKQRAEIITAIKVGATDVSIMKSAVTKIRKKASQIDKMSVKVTNLENFVDERQQEVHQSFKSVKELLQKHIDELPEIKEEVVAELD